jgi:hypothetical protein
MSKLLGLFMWLKSRLSEPSTMASIAAVSALGGVNVDPGKVQDALNIGSVIFGALGFFVAEAKPLTKVD